MKAQIVKGARDWPHDRCSIRDAEISYVIQYPTSAGLMVRVNANTKNAMAGYTGAIEGLPLYYDQGIRSNFMLVVPLHASLRQISEDSVSESCFAPCYPRNV